MARIFISYRRKQSGDVADHLSERLKNHFGHNSIFYDIDFPLGVDFRDYFDNAVSQCDVLLAILDREWSNDEGRKKLNNPRDYVRLEIESALNRDIPVIPVLVGEAEMPTITDLPDSIRGLVFRNSTRLRPGLDKQHDLEHLIKGIEAVVKLGQLGKPASRKPPKKQIPEIQQVLGKMSDPSMTAESVDREESLQPTNKDAKKILLRVLDGFVEAPGDINRILLAGEIPREKSKNAINSYAKEAKMRDVLLLYDNTKSGDATDGLIITANTVYWRNDEKDTGMVRFSDVKRVASSEGFFASDIYVNEHPIKLNKGRELSKVTKILAEMVLNLLPRPGSSFEDLNAITRLEPANDKSNNTSEAIAEQTALQVIVDTLNDFRDKSLFIGTSIPIAKSRKAINKYARGARPRSVLLLYDNTFLGGAREGFIITTDAVYWHNVKTGSGMAHLSAIKTVSYQNGILSSEIYVNGQTLVIQISDHRFKMTEILSKVIYNLSRI